MSNINIKLAEVVSIDDIHNSGRIKAKIYPEDNRKSHEEIPFSYPILPKMFNVLPKVGEAVIIFLTASGDGFSNRYYIGPIIAQLPDLEYAGHSIAALTNYPDSLISPHVDHSLPNDAIGAYGNKEDVCIYGRKGTDIILKEDDIRIRAGARIDGDNKIGKVLNTVNPAYLKLKYYETPQVIEELNDENELIPVKTYNSTATLVADEINLISNQSTRKFTTTENQDLITDSEMDKIIQQAHVLPYGDILVQFLKQFLWEFQNHSHKWPGKLTILYPGHESIYNYDFDKMLSKNVRIN